MSEYVLWQVLQTCRTMRALSQRELAARIGVTQSTYLRWERGSEPVGEEALAKVAAEYGVTIRELLLEGLGVTRREPPARLAAQIAALADRAVTAARRYTDGAPSKALAPYEAAWSEAVAAAERGDLPLLASALGRARRTARYARWPREHEEEALNFFRGIAPTPLAL